MFIADVQDIRKEIATSILTSGWLEQQCRSVCSNHHLAEDLMGEVLLIVLEYKPESALYTAFNNEKHLPFIRKIITNQFNSTTSPFWKKYRKHESITDELFEDSADCNNELFDFE